MTSDMALVAYCNLAKWNSDLPSGYQYFDDVTIGGGFQQMDFCPVYSILYTFDATDDNVGGATTTTRKSIRLYRLKYW